MKEIQKMMESDKSLGMIRVAAATPKIVVANPYYNAVEIIDIIEMAEECHVGIILFPELCLTGYTCGDLFYQEQLYRSQQQALERICLESEELDVGIILGLYLRHGDRLYNCAAFIQNGKIMGLTPKSFIPDSKEYYEGRWFSSASSITDKESFISLLGEEIPFGQLIYRDNVSGLAFGIEICEDLWAPVKPGAILSLNGAHIIFNPSASNELVGKSAYRRELVKQTSASNICGYVYASSGVHESSTDLVFSGHNIIAENGVILAESTLFVRESDFILTELDFEKIIFERSQTRSLDDCARMFSDKMGCVEIPIQPVVTLSKEDELTRCYQPTPFVPADDDLVDERCGEIFSIQSAGLAKRFEGACSSKLIVGVSGGLDSTLALLVSAVTLKLTERKPQDLIAITMPGFGTTGSTRNNAVELAKLLGAELREIPITKAVSGHFSDIGHDPEKYDHTYENAQARERTQILMDIANSENGLVVGTGDLSESALGWSTYNGDHMSMYAVNCSIPKTLIRFVIRWFMDHISSYGHNIDLNIPSDDDRIIRCPGRKGATIDLSALSTGDPEALKKVLGRILDTPISPELLPPDKDGNIVQRTEDEIGPYILHDFFLYYTIRYGMRPRKLLHIACAAFKDDYDTEEIKRWLRLFYRRFFTQQFKRSCMPDGPKVGTVSLSPRGDWRMPSDASVYAWLNELI